MDDSGFLLMSFPIYGIVLFVLIGIPAWRICSRAGFNPAWSLFVLIPYFGALVVVARLALSDWPKFKRDQKSGA
jgi:hypothetical protein